MSGNTKGNISDVYELTPLQQGILFHTLYERNSLPYFIQVRYSLQGALDIPLFERSFNDLLERHAILRTSFVYRGLKQPLQVVLKERKVDFHYEDIHLFNEAEQQAFLAQYLEKDRVKSFDLTHDVLMRVAIIKTAEAQYEFIWTKHHIVLDGWSSSILIADFLTHYYTHLLGKVPQLAPVRPYSDYITYLKGQDKKALRAFYQEFLAGYEQPVSVNANRLNGVHDTVANTDNVEYLLDRHTTAALNELAKKCNVTLNTLFNALWSILLSKLNNVKDVVYGVVVSGRPADVEGIEEMVGLFINTLPMRTQYNNDTTFAELMQTISDGFAKVNQHSSYALTEILAENPLKNRLFDHIVAFENFPVADRVRGANKPWENVLSHDKIITVSAITNSEKSNYGLNVVVNAGEELSVQLEFDANTYDKDYLRSILGYFDNIVRRVLNDPFVVISKVSLLSPRAISELATPYQIDLDQYPINTTIPRALELQALQTPDSVALVFNDISLSYAELNQIVNRFSRYITREFQLSPRQIVGVMLPRSENAIIALLAILKAGCAFLPIDPVYPKDRKKYILADANPSLLLVDSPQLSDMDFYTGQVCAIDAALRASESLRSDDVDAVVDETDLAYVIYTSGSTGQPKGVMIEHRSVVNMALNLMERFGIRGSDRVLQFASLSFDGAVAEIFTSLLNGVTLVMFEDAVIKDARKLLEQLAKHKVSVAVFPAAYLSVIDIDKLNLRVVVTAGEAMNPKDALRCKRYSEVFNGYGPTECCVAAAIYKVSDEDVKRSTIPIGAALANTRIYILDDSLNPVPVGVAGEICIAGVSVARGYLNQPALTNDKFIADPFVPGYRMYRSGDLGRFINGKDIEFIGRKDNQVKIRGYRIELEEIENVLKQHAAIENAKVYVNTTNGSKDICAVVVTRKQTDLLKTTKLFNTNDSRYVDVGLQVSPVPVLPEYRSPDQFVEVIKNYCRSVLPDYMIPSQFRLIDAIPLTVNGKVDLGRLQDSEVIETTTTKESREPKNLIESQLMAIFADILNYKNVGVNDHFFERGGHSIKAIQLMSRISKEFNVDIELKDIFENPVLEHIAALVSEKDQLANKQIPSVPAQAHYALSFAQRRLWVLNQFAERRHAYVITRKYRLKGSLDVHALQRAFARLCERHEILRTAFIVVENEPRQFISAAESSEPKVLFHDLRKSTEPDKVQAEIEADAVEKVLDFENGGLMAANILQVLDDEFILVFAIHHIICDGWSINILISELLNFYNATLQKTKADDQPLKIQYKDYSEWQNGLLKGEYLESLKKYWVNRLQDSQNLNLPFDFPRSASADFKGEVAGFTVGSDLVSKLKKLALAERTTVNTVLMSVYYTFLYKLSGQQGIVVGTSLLGRNHNDLEHTIGFFINTLAVRNTIQPEITCSDLVRRVHASFVEDLKRQDMPFDLLVEVLKIKRDPSITPVFQVRFVYSDLGSENAVENFLPNVEIVQEESGDVTSKFDLSLTMYPEGDCVGGHFEYRTALFKKASIEHFVAAYLSLIEEVVANPEKKISDLKFDAVVRTSRDDAKNQLRNTKLFPIRL